MWSTEITSINNVNGNIVVMVNFIKDGVVVLSEKFDSINRADTSWLKNAVNQRLLSLKMADSQLADLSIGAFSSESVAPTQDEIDQNAWLSKYLQWLQVKKAVDAGILTGSEPQVLALLNTVKTDFRAAYLNLL
jgi:hypothetical protein